ncbi:bromodomain adjacent to zinc finger domain protein 1A [Phlebotomus argentipes]|uniref:bromodomain adjacent to zinc finger domain protein 1A n=1 Tax=Phlebotomus argentipes TaxID=94469 RepID=UPI0028936C0A|nr:bromodomain adjacent to zinc finger domain protein 1A [Phlebotomus argentipes]
MPLMKRKAFVPVPPPDDLQDDEEVFYCSVTKEVFRRHEDYFERVMLINSMLWTCALTGKSNLTYAEALESEQNARETLNNFSKALKTAVVIVTTYTQRSSMLDLTEQVYGYMKDRYFKHEEVIYCPKDEPEITGKVVAIVKDSEECSEIVYKVHLMWNKETICVRGQELRRRKTMLTRDKLKFFIRDNTQMHRGALVIKDSVLKKYTNNSTVKFEHIHIGKPPVFETFIRMIWTEKQPKKQSQISKFFTKDGGDKRSAAKLEASNREIDEINRQAAEKLAQMQAEEQKKLAEERERQKQELQSMVQNTVRAINSVNEDLLLQDQRILPTPKSMELLVPKRFYGNFLMVLEFIHSFSEVLQIRDKFPKGVTIPILQRAFLVRDVAGPLSDIVQVLLATILSLQVEEKSEVLIRYKTISKSRLADADNPIEFATLHATKAMTYPKKYYSMDVTDLPMDATTVSEILRLHLLSSGALLEDDQAVKWRFQTRGGYRNTDDPGLLLRVRHAHIIRALSNRTLYELPLGDIFKILDCLIGQIMTYSSVRDIIDERIEKATSARATMKSLTQAERRRVVRCETEKKDLREEAQRKKEALEVADSEAQQKVIDEELQRKLEKIDAEAMKANKQFMQKLEQNKSQCFDYQVYLGSDRAYRKYWLFNSLPGLFVEHSEEDLGPCFDEVVKNIPELVNCPSDRRYKVIKQLVMSQMKMSEKENNRVNGSKVQSPIAGFSLVSEDSGAPEVSQRDLWMCTSVAESCPVHNRQFAGKVQWSYFHTADEIDALTAALNTRGFREKSLREQLELERELIVAHVITCPHAMLQVNPESKQKILAQYMMDQKKYEAANFQKDDKDINVIMSSVLCDYILDLEWKISQGYLGANKDPNRQLWRDAVARFDYKFMKNGINLAVPKKATKAKDERRDRDKDDTDDDDDSDYEDPGSGLPDSLEVESEDSADEGIPLYDFQEEKKKVHFLATALLQVKRTIDPKYLKWPFGVAKENPKLVNSKLPKTVRNQQRWETALTRAVNYSQVFLHYNVLYDSILWTQSASHAACQICRRKSEPMKMLLCDECNSGYHMFCLKPPLTKIPAGDWFCQKCRKPEAPRSARKRKIFTEDESTEEEDNTQEEESEDEESGDSEEQEESSDVDRNKRKKTRSRFWNFSDTSEDECEACHKSGKLIKCSSCPSSRHSGCVSKRNWVTPGRKWECTNCRKSDDQRQQKSVRVSRRQMAINGRSDQKRKSTIRLRSVQEEPDSVSQDDEDEEPPAKKRKQAVTPRRSLRTYNEMKRQESATERSAKKRRSDENLPLDSVTLYHLLDGIAKHADSWPFNRPVAKVEVPDYYEIIKNPMDFAKIKSKLNCGDYVTNEMLIRDIEQVFQNCDAYNNSDSKIYQAGIRLERYVMRRCKELNLPFKHSDMISDEESEIVAEKSRLSRGRK